MNIYTENNVLYVDGDVTVKTLTEPLFQQFETACRLKDIQKVDFRQVSSADSTCISLLLTAMRYGCSSFNDLPKSVEALIELYEIKSWIHQ